MGKIITTEKFIDNSRKIHGNKYDYSLVNYKKSYSKVIIICPKHGEFLQTPYAHLHNKKHQACLKCMEEERFEEIKQIFHKKGCVLLASCYKNNNTKMPYICHCGNKSTVSLSALISERERCRKCHFAEKTYTLEEAQAIFKRGKCDLLATEYKNVSVKMPYICSCGNKSNTRLADFIAGGRCNKCADKKRADKRRLSFDKVKNIFKEAGCELLAIEYKTINTKMPYICKCGTRHERDLLHFMRGRFCPSCTKEKRRASQVYLYKFDEVKEIFRKRGCVLKSTEYVNVRGELEYICVCGRDARTKLGNFLQGGKCKNCRTDSLTGENNACWNPDREYVKLRKIIGHRCNTMLRNCLRDLGRNKNDRSHVLLGYSHNQLYEHITNHPNWDLVKDIKWHIDHIFPIAAFIKNGIIDVKIINSLDNLQPLYARDNLSKNDNYNFNDFKNWLERKGIVIKAQ